MEEANEARALLGRLYQRLRRRRLIRGLLFFPLSSLLLVILGWNWQGGAHWIPAVILTAAGLYGFADLMAGTRMTDFDASPVGLFLSGKPNKYALEVLLIRHSEESGELDDKDYVSEISFIEKSGVRFSLSVSGREECGLLADYLKERLADRCVIMEMTFQEYDDNRREYLHN